MGEEIGPWFDVLPDKARGRWRGLGRGIVLLGSLALFFGCLATSTFGGVAVAPGLALWLVGAVWIAASRWMPRRRPEGALEAAKWRAFRRYLLNLEDYGDQTEAQEILDRYFAYAVALDVQEVVLRDAERLQAQMPVWTRPVIVTSGGAAPDGGSVFAPTLSWRPAPISEDSSTAGAPASDSNRPADWSLSGKSRQMGASLSLASLSLSRTLTAATGSSGGSTMDAMNKAVRTSSGSSATRFSGGSSRSSSTRSGSSSRSSSSRSSSRSRSSSSRSSGGGGRRGFK